MSYNVTNLKRVAPDVEVLPGGDIGRPGPLASIRDVRREMSRVYGKVCRGHVPPEVATKMIYMLDRVGRLVELETVEARLVALERGTDAIDQ